MEKLRQAAKDAKLRADLAEKQLDEIKRCDMKSKLSSRILQLQNEIEENKTALKKKIIEVEELQQTTKKLVRIFLLKMSLVQNHLK